MSKRNIRSLSGPAVQKREAFVVVGLIAAWILVVYFFVRAPHHHVKNVDVDRSLITQARADPMMTTLASPPDRPRMDPQSVERVLLMMKSRTHTRPDWLGTLVTTEITPIQPEELSTTADEAATRLSEDEPSLDESLDQDGEFLESQPLELQPPATTEPSQDEPLPARDPIKS